MYYSKSLERLHRWFSGCPTLVEFVNKEVDKELKNHNELVMKREAKEEKRRERQKDRNYIAAMLTGVEEKVVEVENSVEPYTMKATLLEQIVSSPGGLNQYCKAKCLDIPILRNTDPEQALTMNYQIIEASIKLRIEMVEHMNVLRSDYVLRATSDTLTTTEADCWNRATGDRRNGFLGEDFRVNPVPAALAA